VSQSSPTDSLIEQLRTHLPVSLLDIVDHRLTELSEKLNVAELKIQVLEEKLRLARIKRYGAKSEKLSSLQLQLLDLEPGVSSEEVEAETVRPALEPIQKQNQQKRKDRKRHPGRSPLPESLPRVERTLPCTEEQLHCKQCGSQTTVIGYDRSEVLDVKPAEYFVLVTKREKRACRCCPEAGVMAAPMSERIIPKCLVSDRVVIDTMLNKYTAHTPLYRQSALLERDTGVLIGRTTMDGWMMRSGDLLLLLNLYPAVERYRRGRSVEVARP
jgi:transposase